MTTTATKTRGTSRKRDVTRDLTDIDAALAASAEQKPADVKPTRGRTTRSRPAKDVAADVAPPVEPYKLKSFTTRDVPWAKIGNIGEAALSAADAAKRGGLDFEVELLDAGFRSSVRATNHSSSWRVVGNRKACVRKDTQQFLSYVSSTYTPVQFSEALSFMDAISPRYVAAGTLGGGRQGFMVVQLPERQSVELSINRGTDALDLYVITRTSHDLTRAIEVSVMMLREQCMNALTLSSFTSGAVQRWAVKHIGADPMSKLRAATLTLTRANDYVESFVKTAQTLASTKVELEEADDLLHRILPARPRRDAQVNAILQAWRESPTNGHPNNGWGLVNAVSEYFEWGRSDGARTDQSRFTSGLNGATHKFTNRTAQVLLRRG